MGVIAGSTPCVHAVNPGSSEAESFWQRHLTLVILVGVLAVLALISAILTFIVIKVEDCVRARRRIAKRKERNGSETFSVSELVTTNASAVDPRSLCYIDTLPVGADRV